MKKQLLLGTALLAAISAFPQRTVQKSQGAPFNMGAYLAQKFERQYNPIEPATSAAPSANPNSAPQYGPVSDPSAAAKSAIIVTPSWQPFTGSMNIYGNLVSTTKPLHYNDELCAISFIHRKSADYAPIPFPSSAGAEAGAIVGMITDRWGQNGEWDTTLVWNDDDLWARYPQGGLYNPVGNKRLDSAFMVATGPITEVTPGWSGSFLASKQLDTLGGPRNDASISAVSNSTFYIANTSPFPSGKFDFPRHDFSVTDDGVVRSLGFLVDDVNATTNAAYGWKGASVVTGTFYGTSFGWSSDSIMPDIFVSPAGSRYVIGTPHMAWNESGTVGFVWFIGVRNQRVGQGDTASNMGYQPIVYKTTNSGATWNELPRIDFNTGTGPGFTHLFNHILGVQGNSIGIPFFGINEGMDGTVDRNDRLHIMSTVVGTYSRDPDSLGYTYILTHPLDGEAYRFGHRPGLRPYIYDFSETPTGWNVTLIDSMSSEAPGTAAGDDGYGSNVWDAAGGSSGTDKVDTDARMQMSRTPDGRYIVYTWAESDTNITSLSRKWNSLPNIKARMVEIGLESGTTPGAIAIHPLEINVTSPSSTVQPPYVIQNQVKGRATMHHVSPKCAIISPTAGTGVAIALPITVSNNTNFEQLKAVTHWFSAAALNFDGVSLSSLDYCTNPRPEPKEPEPCDTCVGIAKYASLIANSMIYPNPANNSAQLVITLLNSSNVDLTVINTVGQVVRTVSHSGKAGKNNIELELNNMPTGIYMLHIKVGDIVGTKKLVIQH